VSERYLVETHVSIEVLAKICLIYAWKTVCLFFGFLFV